MTRTDNQAQHPVPMAGAGHRWSWWGWVMVAAACWAVLRLEMNGQYGPASWERLAQLRAPLPFGHRVLIPMIAHAGASAGIPVKLTFLFSECIAAIVLVSLLDRALRQDLPRRWAELGALLFLPVTALPLLLNHRWAIFYPWDSWAGVFLLAGASAGRQGHFGRALLWTVIGAYNRESAILVPGLLLALYLDRRPLQPVVAWCSLMLVGYTVARATVPMLVPDAKGVALHLWVDGHLRVLNNLRWLSDMRHLLQWCGSMALAPLWWFWARKWAPGDLWRMHLPILVAWLALGVVANVYEPRVYGELLVLSWWMMWTGVWRWINDERRTLAHHRSVRWLDRYGALVTISGGVWALWLVV